MSGLHYFFLVITFFYSCSGETKRNESVAEKKKVQESKPAYAFFLENLMGHWENRDGDFLMTESWQKLNDSTFAGASFVIEKGDTVFRESLRIEEHSKTLFYIPTVRDQNEGKPVEFELTTYGSGIVVFKNPAHDFPTAIQYHFLNNDSLIAEISGIRNGKEAKEVFPYKRIK